jgi:hypothetical protein
MPRETRRNSTRPTTTFGDPSTLHHEHALSVVAWDQRRLPGNVLQVTVNERNETDEQTRNLLCCHRSRQIQSKRIGPSNGFACSRGVNLQDVTFGTFCPGAVCEIIWPLHVRKTIGATLAGARDQDGGQLILIVGTGQRDGTFQVRLLHRPLHSC